MKIIMSLIAVVMMSACAHHGHNHQAGEKCTHCESGTAPAAKGEKCKGGCH